MNLRKTFMTAAGIGVLAGLAALLLGGCSSGGSSPAITTGVTGFVVDAALPNPGIGNMVITVGGVNGVSTTPQGAFTVAAPAGLHQLLTVQESTLFVPVSDAPVYVDVVAGQVTALPGPFFVVDRNSLPPPA